jgi:hypothetical protein
MHRLLTTTAVALLLGVAPALAIDDSSQDQSNTVPEASQSNESSSTLPSEPGMTPDESEPSQPQALNEPSESGDQGQLPTQPGVSPDVAKEAFDPGEGSPDTSGGAQERSSAPPDSGASSAGGTADAQSSDIPSPESEIERGPAAAEKPGSSMESESSKE